MSHDEAANPRGADASASSDQTATPEDLVCLQAAVDEWQRERAELIRKLQASEGGAQEKLQLSATRLREALEQIEALKRSANAVRARLEAEAQAAGKRAEQAHAALERSNAAAEELRVANAELTTALEAAQFRLADLETESSVHQEEIARLEREQAAQQEQLGVFEADIAALRQALEAVPHTDAGKAAELTDVSQELATLRTQQAALQETASALGVARDELQAALEAAREQHASDVQAGEEAQRRLGELESVIGSLREHEADLAKALEDAQRERAEAGDKLESITAQVAALEAWRAQALHELDATNAAYEAELNAWQATATERESELVAARDELARKLEDEQSQTYLAQEEAAALSERIRGLEADLHQAVQAREAVTQELAIEREERQRAIALLEDAARQREEAHRRDLDELRSVLRGEQATLAEHMSAIQTERDVARQRCGELERELTAAIAEQQRLSADRETQQAEQTALKDRLATIADELQGRDARVEQLDAEIRQLGQQCVEALQAAEAGSTQAQKWQAEVTTLQEQLNAVQKQAAERTAELTAAQAQMGALDEQLARRTTEASEARAQVDAITTVTRQHLESLAGAAQREVVLQQRCDELSRQAESLQAQVAAAHIEHTGGTARIDELEAERRALRLQVDETTAVTAQLERECERLRRDRSSSEDARKIKSENARLEAKIAEIERQHSEAVQRHSAAVAGYMVELNQRAEALKERELEFQRVTEELGVTRQACEDATAQLAADRQERADLEQQLSALRAATAGAQRAATDAARKVASPPPAPTRPGPVAARPPVGKAGKPAVQEVATGPITLIHLEENTAFRETVREVLSRMPDSRYLNTLDLDRPTGSGRRVLAVNLLNRAHDPLSAIAASVGADADQQNVFAYCADGSYGFAFGPVDFFPQPVNPDSCVSRLLESRGMVQRLLAVSENIEMTSGLREVFRRMNCSTSVALDLRQVMDLLPMIDPDVVMVDLALPRGDGLRLVSRLRADPKTRELPLAILLPAAGNVVEFRQHAMRAAREASLSPAELAQTLAQRLGAPPPADAPAKGAGLLQSA